MRATCNTHAAKIREVLVQAAMCAGPAATAAFTVTKDELEHSERGG